MIEEIHGKRIKIMEIVVAIIILVLFIWILCYELFFNEKKDSDIIVSEIDFSENDYNEIDEKNIYDTYITKDQSHILKIVRTSDRKAYNDARNKYQEAYPNTKYRNKNAIYFGYLNDLVFSITKIDDKDEYLVISGQLIDNEQENCNFIVNKKLKIIEEPGNRINNDKRFFNNKGSQYYLLKVNKHYFFREELDDKVSLLYTSNWIVLGYIKNDYVPSNETITVFTNNDLKDSIQFDLDGKKLVMDSDN